MILPKSLPKLETIWFVAPKILELSLKSRLRNAEMKRLKATRTLKGSDAAKIGIFRLSSKLFHYFLRFVQNNHYLCKCNVAITDLHCVTGKVSDTLPNFCAFGFRMKPTVIEDILFEFEPFDEECSVLMAAEASWRGMGDELQELHYLKGARFINQLKLIICYGEFHPVEGETNIFSAISEKSDDFDNLINAARKAVAHGNNVYILPNPKGIRTADFIFENKGVYKMYDLKTIHGKASVLNRLLESVGQTTHVLLNMATDYRAISLAGSIKKYFEINPNAMEVLVFKGNKSILLKRTSVESRDFFKTFVKRYNK